MVSQRTILTFSALFLFLAASIVGPSMSMPIDGHGHMANCPFAMGATSLCGMTVFEHISAWENMFASSVPTGIALLLLLLALTVVVRTVHGQDPPEPQDENNPTLRTTTVPFVSPLLSAFSQGILHPKIYPIATR